jgi:hypothetical protein
MGASSREEVIVGGSVPTTFGRKKSIERRSCSDKEYFVFIEVGLVFSDCLISERRKRSTVAGGANGKNCNKGSEE